MELQTDLFDFDFTFSDHDPFPSSSPNPMSVDDVEHFLFKEDDDDEVNYDGFLDDILLDSPVEEQKSGEVVDLSDSTEDQKNEASVEEKDDPLAKKRKRQLRNKDAALRSRERKKMLVKDLEMKSRYYEGECRRLGSLLQWYMAENQALRFTLHSTSSSNASMTKQESAVLFLESLLLGSLLWLVGILVVLPSLVLLLILHRQGQSQVVTAVEEKHLPSLAPRKGRSKTILVGKRFKYLRSRMRNSVQVVSSVLSVVF